jgi:hypothetical protein
MRSTTLALVPTTPQLPALSYIGGVVTEPALIAFAVPSAMIGLGAAGIFGATIAVACVLMIAFVATRLAIVRRYVEHRQVERAAQRSETRRRARLRGANPMRSAQYLELRELVGELERTNAAAAKRYELLDLLDHFVGVAVQLEHYNKTLRMVGGDVFPTLATGRAGGRCRAIAERRRAAASNARARVDQLADELDAIEELIKLIVLQVAAPSAVRDDLIVERLAELDEVDRGMRQLDAMCAES